jgi:hypothetical protein
MKPETVDARDQELRRTLVATADLTPYTRRRISPKLVIAAIAAFAIAGALTGGAVASATSINDEQLATNAALQGASENWISEEDGKLLGLPILRATSGTVIIQLGKAPAGANVIATAFECTDKGKFEMKLDGKFVEGTDCSKSTDGTGNGGLGGPFVGLKDHTLTVTGPPSARFTVWLSWAHTPTLKPSTQQTAELADGVVTRAEDIAAFERYAVCMAALGHSIGNPADSEYNAIPSYGIDDAAVNSGADNRCYVTQYQDVDDAWQAEVEKGTEASYSIRECLTDLGVNPAASTKQEMDQFNSLQKNWQDCTYVG